MIIKTSAAGATPKLTISEMESSTFPVSEVAFRSLAVRPSRKSNREAITIKRAAASRFL